VLCPKGSYCPNVTSKLLCAAGSYSDQFLSTACAQCAAGSYATQQGSTACTACAAGSACPQSVPVVCAAGTYTSAAAQTACVACAFGRYASGSGSTVCLLCSKGSLPATTSCPWVNASWGVVAPLQPQWPSLLQLQTLQLQTQAVDTAALAAICTFLDVSGDGSFAVCASSTRHVLLRLDFATHAARTLLGTLDEPGSDLQHLNGPAGVAVSSDGSFAVVCDSLNNRVLRLSLPDAVAEVIVPHPMWQEPGYSEFLTFFTPLRPLAIAMAGDIVWFTESGDPSGKHHVWLVILQYSGSCWHTPPVAHTRVWSTADTIAALSFSPDASSVLIAGAKRLSCVGANPISMAGPFCGISMWTDTFFQWAACTPPGLPTDVSIASLAFLSPTRVLFSNAVGVVGYFDLNSAVPTTTAVALPPAASVASWKCGGLPGVGMLANGSCAACAPGTYSDGLGMRFCAACASGTYASGAGGSSCLGCPNGILTATQCTQCAPGKYLSAGALLHCLGLGERLRSLSCGHLLHKLWGKQLG